MIWSAGRSTPTSSWRYAAHSCELMPCIAGVASSRQRPPCSAATLRRAASHRSSDSTSTPSRSKTTARIISSCLPASAPTLRLALPPALGLVVARRLLLGARLLLRVGGCHIGKAAGAPVVVLREEPAVRHARVVDPR